VIVDGQHGGVGGGVVGADLVAGGGQVGVPAVAGLGDPGHIGAVVVQPVPGVVGPMGPPVQAHATNIRTMT
jgi:hypothetical protein